MKIWNITKTVLLASSLIVAGVGCKKDKFAINTSPEDLTASVVDYTTVMPAAMATSARIIAADWKFLQNWMGYWARSGSYQSVVDEETYSFTNEFPAAANNGIGNPWADLYSNCNNYNYVITNAKTNGAGFYEAASRIMTAQNFQLLVDLYGNVPYFETFRPFEIRTPKYDTGLDIYKDLFRQLDTAISLLKDPEASSLASNPGIVQNDLVFKGDAQLWIKLANTLKLRLLVHSFAVPEIDAAGEVAIIEAEGSGYLGLGENALINPGYSASKPNPFYRAYGANENGILSGTGDLEKANEYAVGDGTAGNPGYYRYNGDIREDKFYIKPDINTSSSVYEPATYHKGIPYGTASGVIPNTLGSNLSAICGYPGSVGVNTGSTKEGPASSAWIFTSFESLFLQAEARQRGIISSGLDADSLTRAGFRASFEYLGFPSDSAESYRRKNLGYPDVDFNAAGGGLFTILSQKWFALNNFAPFEVWTDFRRTDIVYGELVGFLPGPPISTLADAGSVLPYRLYYPQSEYSYNEANVQAQGFVDVFSVDYRIFWDR